MGVENGGTAEHRVLKRLSRLLRYGEWGATPLDVLRHIRKLRVLASFLSPTRRSEELGRRIWRGIKDTWSRNFC